MYTSHRCVRRSFSGTAGSRHRIPSRYRISRYNEIIRKLRRAAMEMKLDLSGGDSLLHALFLWIEGKNCAVKM